MNSVECYYCGESYSGGDLQQHMKEKHYFQCKYCDKFYETVKEIEDHNKTQHLKFKCAHCDENYISEEQLTLHIKAKHCIECSFCDKSFISIKDLNFHTRYAHLPVECYHCDSYFRSKGELEQHIKIKHCFQCPGCSESFKSIEIRNNHDKNVHLTIECLYCDQLFRKDEYLQKHIEDQHKFVCEWCKKSFKSSAGKNFHQGCIYITFACYVSDCTEYFPTKAQLVLHESKRHYY